MSPHCEYSFFSTAVTLKIRSRSPKSNQFFAMSQLYIHGNLVRIQPVIHKILFRQESVTEFSQDIVQTRSVTPTRSAPKTICPPSPEVVEGRGVGGGGGGGGGGGNRK